MSRKQAFIDFVDDLIENCEHPVGMSKDAEFYWNYLKNSDDKETENPMFTENGKRILKFLQEHEERDGWKSKDMAEFMEISSRSIAGGMRKLVNDGFVEKLEENPAIYAITTKGKEINIEE